MSFMNKMPFLSRWKFHSEELAESTDHLVNPSCGWYRMFPFELDKEPDYEQLSWCLRKNETLVQVVVLIGAYRESVLPQEALDRFAGILDFFRMNQKEMILRVAYDGTGNGLMAEPSEMKFVLWHMQQLGPVIAKYEKDILVVQGLFIGSWGELHDSRYLSREKLCELAECLRTVIGERMAIAVRTPVQWRMLHKYNTSPGTDKICIFNDGMFGSELDLGTYGIKKQDDAEWLESWCREDELAFMEKMHRMAPYGGEAIGTAQEGKLASAVRDMVQTHLCYLNAEHDGKCLERWKGEVWEEKGIWKGISGIDYIGAHLGYRPVIRKVAGHAAGGLHLELSLVNAGFAYLLEEAQLLVSLQADGTEDRVQMFSIEPKDFAPGSLIKISCQFAEEKADGEYSIYAQMRRKRDGRAIQIANGQDHGKIRIGTWSSL